MTIPQQGSKSTVVSAATTLGVALVGIHLLLNHWRIKKSNHDDDIVVTPDDKSRAKKKDVVVVFLPGTSQNARTCVGRMAHLAASGYECHALNLAQTNSYTTSYAGQFERIDEHVSSWLKGRPFVLAGHSQGGCKAQLYALRRGRSEGSLRGLVLLASAEMHITSSAPDVLANVFERSPLATFVASMIGPFLYLEPLSFAFGGGTKAWRHALGLYRGMFLPSTTGTNLTGEELSLPEFADAAIDDHDPFIADVFSYDYDGAAKRANKCRERLSVLHVVAGDDRIVPRRQSDAISKQWGVEATVIPGQGHELGDPGWEESVMGPIISFLDGLDR